VRVIAGEFEGAKGPAKTFTPINLWDLRLPARMGADLRLPAGHTTALFVLRGKVLLNGSEAAEEAELALFERDGEEISVKAETDTTILGLDGKAWDRVEQMAERWIAAGRLSKLLTSWTLPHFSPSTDCCWCSA
jgi:redox-sensitive bicupin YhaK (pirin superfamily)